ncbi:hypothetical protein EH30_09490 [Erythrobacter sp. JL475]|nr:hypothetical protein EH30_09490 [Erythrobacter sp. JL475]
MGAPHCRTSRMGAAGARLARTPGDPPPRQGRRDCDAGGGRGLYMGDAGPSVGVDFGDGAGRDRRLDRDAQRIVGTQRISVFLQPSTCLIPAAALSHRRARAEMLHSLRARHAPKFTPGCDKFASPH